TMSSKRSWLQRARDVNDRLLADRVRSHHVAASGDAAAFELQRPCDRHAGRNRRLGGREAAATLVAVDRASRRQASLLLDLVVAAGALDDDQRAAAGAANREAVAWAGLALEGPG